MKHTRQELAQWQALPLGIKVRMTQQRIRDWVREYGVDGVYVSLSGGKDSTVLLHLVRELYPDVKAVFCNTGLEYPEIVQFVKTVENVEWLRPKKTFRQVIKDYGYPFISKEVSESVYGAKKYLTKLMKETDASQTDRQIDRPTDYSLRKFIGLTQGSIPSDVMKEVAEMNGDLPYKVKELLGISKKKDGTASMFDYSKWLMLVNCPYSISHHCCNVMKKAPMHNYQKKTGRNPMTGQMASESRLRTQEWLQHGCNGFDLKVPTSNPMAFWTEQDVLLYILRNNIQIASIYGDVVVDWKASDMIPGQLTMADIYEDKELFDLDRPILKTTGVSRTGCMFCGYGAHLEKPGEGRFERMKETHPKLYDYIMRPSGLNYKEVIDWLNENAGTNIRY